MPLLEIPDVIAKITEKSNKKHALICIWSFIVRGSVTMVNSSPAVSAGERISDLPVSRVENAFIKYVDIVTPCQGHDWA